MMRRRLLLAALWTSAALPGAGIAQDAKKVWRVGFMSPYSLEYDKARLASFRDGMRALGYVEGKNLHLEIRHSQSEPQRFKPFARELAKFKIDVFLVHGTAPAVEAARDETSGIPIVIVANPDPVGQGFAASLARPGGNITGLSDMHAGLGPKRLELLKELAPKATRFGILFDPSSRVARRHLEELQEAAPALQVRLVPVQIRAPTDIPAAFEAMKRQKVDAFHILFGAVGTQAKPAADLALKHGLPAIGTTRQLAEAGLLLSYGASFPELYRRAATYVHRIFKGAKPADLPIEQPTKFELVVNVKTARAMGIAVPPSLLQRADHVIE